MSNEEKKTWKRVKGKLELQLWDLIEKEHDIMEQIVMVDTILKEGEQLSE